MLWVCVIKARGSNTRRGVAVPGDRPDRHQVPGEGATTRRGRPTGFHVGVGEEALMIGYIAESKSENFKLDEVELDEGRWFSKEELKKALSGENKNFFVPPPMAIAHHLIKAFVESK